MSALKTILKTFFPNQMNCLYHLTGVALWIAVDCTSVGLNNFEVALKKKMLSAGLNISSCKAVQLRSK